MPEIVAVLTWSEIVAVLTWSEIVAVLTWSEIVSFVILIFNIRSSSIYQS
jgi:hypothetical protein